MASLVLTMAALVVVPILLQWAGYASQSPLWTTACLLLCLGVGCVVYSAVLYPVLLTPFKELPMPRGRSLWAGHFPILRKAHDGHQLKVWSREVPNDGLMRFYTLFNKERLLATSERAVADILVHKSADFDKPAYIRFAISQVAGFGLLTAQGGLHRAQRKALSPAFSHRQVKALHPLFWSKSVEMVQAMAASMGSERVVRIADWASRVTLDVAGMAAIGLDFGSVHDRESRLHGEYARLLRRASGADVLATTMVALLLPGCLEWLPTRRTRAAGPGTDYIRTLARELIREKRREQAKTAAGGDDDDDDDDAAAIRPADIISTCLDSGLSDDGLAEQLMTLLVAGHESTASALQWAVYALCKHPDVQTRLRDEVRGESTPLSLSPGDAPPPPPLDSLPYLGAFINEVLRVFPPLPETERVALRDTSVDGVAIPRGTTLVIGHEAINHSVSLWGPDADDFIPDRWMGAGRNASSGGASSHYALVSFLHGPRGCIAAGFARAEMACLVAALVGAFEMELEDPTAGLEITGFATLKPKDGVRVRLRVN